MVSGIAAKPGFKNTFVPAGLNHLDGGNDDQLPALESGDSWLCK